jgi:tetratricopeptide (TPR) repeat protein
MTFQQRISRKSAHCRMKTFDFHKSLFHVLLIILLSLLAYSNTIHVPFHFDDANVIVENPIIKDLRFFADPSKAEVFKGHFEYKIFTRRYIGYLSFALNYAIHGLNVAGYHIINLFIHIGNALLIYLLVILSFRTPFLKESPIKSYAKYTAVFTALLFACHPLQTQAVTYIWQRVTSLATLLYILSLVTYVKWRIINQNTEKRQKTIHLKSVFWYLTSLFSAVLAMKTKEIAFMLPLMVTLYEFLFFQGKRKRRILYVLPLLLTMLIVPFSLLSMDQPVGELIGDVSEVSRGITSLSRWEYLLAEFRVIVTYIRLIFVPIHQNLDYDYPKYHSFFQPGVFLSFVLLVSIFGFSIYLFYRSRHTSTHIRLIPFGIVWFFVNLLLESSIIPLNNVIFEHRVYLPSIGVFLALSASLFILVEKLRHRWKSIGNAVVGVLAVIVVVLTGTTYARNSVWEDKFSLWSDVVRKSPNNARAQNNLGFIYQTQGFIDKAMEHYRIAIKLYPTYLKAHINLGSAYESQGFFGKAIEEYLIALKISPDDSVIYYNLGNLYMSQGLVEKAMEQYLVALKINPGYLEAHNNLGNVYISQGLVEKAMEQYLTALKIKPDYLDSHNNLGNVYMSQGMFDKAIEHYKTALKINPYIQKIHYNLGVAYQSKGLINKAQKHFETARLLKHN